MFLMLFLFHIYYATTQDTGTNHKPATSSKYILSIKNACLLSYSNSNSLPKDPSAWDGYSITDCALRVGWAFLVNPIMFLSSEIGHIFCSPGKRCLGL